LIRSVRSSGPKNRREEERRGSRTKGEGIQGSGDHRKEGTEKLGKVRGDDCPRKGERGNRRPDAVRNPQEKSLNKKKEGVKEEGKQKRKKRQRLLRLRSVRHGREGSIISAGKVRGPPPEMTRRQE